MRIRTIALAMGVAAVAAGVVLGTAVGHHKSPTPKTWTTVFQSPVTIEGLTLDEKGNLYVPQRDSAAGCPIVKVSSTGGANGPNVGRIAANVAVGLVVAFVAARMVVRSRKTA